MTTSYSLRKRLCTLGSWIVFWVLCLAPLAQGGLRPPQDLPDYRLHVSIDPSKGTIRGQATISIPSGRELRVDPGELDIQQIKHRGRSLPIKRRADGLLVLPSPVDISFSIDVSKTEDNFIKAEEVLLLGLWYPVVEGFCRFQVTAVVPAGYLAVSEAEEINYHDQGDHREFIFAFPQPLHDEDGVTLAVSNRWQVAEANYKGLALSVYLYPEQAHLASRYLERTKQTLAKYENLLAPFPYRRLALVANAQEVTQAFPTYILIDQQEFKITDLDRSPLDHEILHQWFGTAVSGDLDHGNWFEGLTVYLADHLLMEEKGQGWQCRRRILSGFQAYMQRQREFPLRDFTERLDKHSRVIGYGKGAMVFHMLRRQIGDVAFFEGLRRFVRQNLHTCASWADLARAFQQASGQNLTWFFQQWVASTGQPEISLSNVSVKQVGQEYKVKLKLSQQGPTKRLSIPITFYGEERSRTITVALKAKTRQAIFSLDFLPTEVVIDEQYDVFRKLSQPENPPTVERLTTGPLQIAATARKKETCRTILETLQKKGVAFKLLVDQQQAAGSSTPPGTPLLILGPEHPWVPRLFGTVSLPPEGLTALIRPHPQKPDILVGLINCAPEEDPQAAVREILTYPFASDVQVVRGQIAWRYLAPTDQGLRYALPPIPQSQ